MKPSHSTRRGIEPNMSVHTGIEARGSAKNYAEGIHVTDRVLPGSKSTGSNKKSVRSLRRGRHGGEG